MMRTTNDFIGKKFSRHSYGEIVGVDISTYTVKNEQGISWSIGANLLHDEFQISDDVVSQEKVTATQMAHIFITNPHVICTVNFNKKVDKKVVKETLYDLYANKGGKVISESTYKRAVNTALDNILNGEERIMVGRHHGEVDEMGRIQFIDMEQHKDESKSYDTRLRKVDPRTINWMIINKIKYIL